MEAPMASLCVIGTVDSKAKELQFLSDTISSSLHKFVSHHRVKVTIIDVSTKFHNKWDSTPGSDIVSVEEVLQHHPTPSRKSLSSLPSDKATALSIVSTALEHYLQSYYEKGKLIGAIGIGGSCGTSLIAPALRALPLGFPKVLVSTMACGDTSPYIGTSDLILIPSVVDIAGLNSVSKTIFFNAALALVGMVAPKASNGLDACNVEKELERPAVGLTMFGVTTPCVDAVRQRLETLGFETLVFHATGAGGRAMEHITRQGFLKGILDITTTEVVDYLVGGVMPCDSSRFEAAIDKKIPVVLTVGALDMVNFGSKDTIPAKFAHRKLFVHNDQVTLMRTTIEENKEAAQFIARKMNLSAAPVRVLLPEKGISALDCVGKPFYDKDATNALFVELENSIERTTERDVRRLPHHINDPEFADALTNAFLEIFPSPLMPGNSTHKPAPVIPKAISKFEMNKIPPISSVARPETLRLRESVLERLRQQISRGTPVIGAGAGTGISAKFEEQGGADLIVIYNSGRFRMAGRGSLSGLMPYKDANAVVLEMADEVIPVVKNVPVLAGVCASDPFRRMDKFLKKLEDIGFVGVQNFPTVGLIDGNFRENLEETGMGYGLEVDMIRKAHEMGFLTTPYAFNEAESSAMAQAGADIIVAHMGLTTSGSIGAKTALSLEDSVTKVQRIADAAHAINPDILVLCHGGPISGPKEAAFILQKTSGVHGFYGASSMERLPVEEAITRTVKDYKAIVLQCE